MWRSPARGTALLARGGWLLPGGSGLPAREVLMLPQWLGALGVCSAAPTPLSPDIPAASPLLPTGGSSPPSGAALVPPARWLGVRALRSVARPQRPAVEEKADDAAAGASGAGARAAGAGGAAGRAEAGLHKLGARLARLRLPQEAPPQDAEARRSQELDAYLERERGLGSLPPPPPPAMEDVPREAQRSVRIGLVGLPNAGKSVLVNAMVGGKISAVSRKVNTTQRATLGIKTTGTCQMVFYDLPGVIARDQMRHRNIERVASAWAAAAGCDVLLFVVDSYHESHSPSAAVRNLARDLSRAGQLPGLRDWKCPPCVLVLTKMDRLRLQEKRDAVTIAEDLLERHPFFDVHYVSGEKADGLGELEEIVTTMARASPWEYPPDAKTDRSPEMVALEVTREKLYQRVNQELPYRCAVKHVDWQYFRDGSVRVEQEILVRNQVQRGIIVGAKGEVVGSIGLQARKELERLWGVPVHLVINVVVD